MTKEFISRKTAGNFPKPTSQFAPRPFATPQRKPLAQAENSTPPNIQCSPESSNLLSRIAITQPEIFTPQLTVQRAEQAQVATDNPGEGTEKIQRSSTGNNRLAKISIQPPEPPSTPRFPIQAKLTVGAAGDKYEQEADRVARQVVNRIHAPQVNLNSSQSNPVQRKISIQAFGGEGGDVSSEWESELNRARGGGQPLSPSLREPMEREFGADFSGVRVHTGAKADGLAKSIQAKAFTKGQDVFFRQGAYESGSRGGQELMAHELTHVVQQNGGVVRRSSSTEFAATETPKNIKCRENCIDGGSVVQRLVHGYKPGTLAKSTIAMRDLSLAQMKIIQQLHDDTTKHYTIDEARQVAVGISTSSNPYAWEVTGITSYATTDVGVQSIFDNFGQPTQSVVKTYDDLASRVGYDVGKDRKGVLSASTISDLHQHFEASKPLHLSFNPFLNLAWTGNLDDYSGSKTGIPLYSVMRSAITKNFEATLAGAVTLNEVLKEVSGRPAELHHLLFKAHYPNLATNPFNLQLTERSESETKMGPGQHELMHMVASGKHSNKFNELLGQYKNEYEKWLKGYNISL
ncbi:DUF4157 domain-containing protein [Laspinema sp. D1]|uniref:DUF4157 domain-containing protein n=1 Tax=Laspinema palackyanum D2a TaxID=2953684 RepID=A0ABT2MST2_9CYAN|nr:DUF4157 domain-containing protein [Laspinema sp. D2a]